MKAFLGISKSFKFTRFSSAFIPKNLSTGPLKKDANLNKLEIEIMKSYQEITTKYNLLPKKIKQTKTEEHKMTRKQFEDNYINKLDPSNEVDKIIKSIYQEEVLNFKETKELEKLILFIRNCKKYNYPEYLKDGKYFRNKEIRNFITNTTLLENLHQKSSKFSVQADFEAKIKVQT
jgi:hypothetical protein